MSIYSGFATRQQQQSYDQLIEDLVFVLQKRIIKFYNHENADESKFLDVLIQLHQQMAKMEENKYLQPKSSKSIEDLLRFLLKNFHDDKDKNQKNTTAKDLKSIGGTVPVLKNSRLDPNSIENKLNSHRDSLARLHEPTSIGKIIKQFHHDTSHQNQSNNSLADSRNTFINQTKINKNQSGDRDRDGNGNGNRTPPMKNPQQQQQINMKANMTQVQYKSRFKGKQLIEATTQAKKDKTRDYLLEYLQKNNKNYLRGYRKRQIKTRAYSKEYSAL